MFIDHVGLQNLADLSDGYVLARYTFPSADISAARKMAVQIASGQTLGFLPSDAGPYQKHLARVVTVEKLSESSFFCEIAFPATLFGSDVAGLLTVLFGKISFAPGIRLHAVSADQRFISKLKSSKFGLDGIRKLAGVSGKHPLLMAILKPGIGVSDRKIASTYAELIESGVHLVKDDEVLVDQSLDSALRRLEHVLSASGGKGVYVQALNGPAFELRERALRLQKSGAKAFLVCPMTYGLSVIQSLATDDELKCPIFAHPAFTGVMQVGMGLDVLLGTFMRWSSVDAVLFPSPYGSIALEKSQALSLHQELVKPMNHLQKVASIPSAGIVPAFVKTISQDFGCDVVINAGTGIAKEGVQISKGVSEFLSEIEAHFVRGHQ